MNILRTTMRFTSTFLFRFGVLFFPVFAAFAFVFSSPTHIQTALRESGVYQTAPGAALQKINEEAQKEVTQGKPNLVADKGVQDAIRNSIDTRSLEGATEEITTGVSKWLQGESAKLDFKVDLRPMRDVLLTNLGQYAEQRAAGLPPCSPQELLALSQGGGNRDPLTMTCLPAEVTPAQVGTQLKDEALKQVEFLRDPVINSDELYKDPKNAPDEQLPQLYQMALALPLILLGLIVIGGAATILLHTKRRRGWQIVGTAFLAVGLPLLVVNGLFLLAYNGENSIFSQPQLPQEFQISVGRAIGYLLNQFALVLVVVSGVYVALGMGIWIAELKTRSKVRVEPPRPPEPRHDTLPPVAPSADDKAQEQTKSPH